MFVSGFNSGEQQQKNNERNALREIIKSSTSLTVLYMLKIHTYNICIGLCYDAPCSVLRKIKLQF